MKIEPIKTHRITGKDTDIFSIIDTYIPKLEENSILVVTSKIVSICEGRIQKIVEETKDKDKEKLVEEESEYFIDKKENEYGFYLTITHGLLIPTAGIDESNGNGFYILWPKDPQNTTNKIREHLAARFNLKNVGVIITDSKTTPLRNGTTGAAISHSGFNALNNYIGLDDLFGRELRVTKSNVMDGLAAASVVTMGEGDEATPLAIISDIPNVEFVSHDPTKEDIDLLKISIDIDLYGSILKRAPWQKGLK